ncbi:MAG: OprO/OprP family phosphate-selective porin [Rikenellaceae bacterium]|nr:OprO/OprP family phosphate-selective porin [Rikenellaceae bacterium]
MNKIIHTAAALFIFLAGPILRAQEITGVVRDHEDRIRNVETVLSKLPKISGLVNVRYQYNDLDDSNGFDVRRARLDFRGALSPRFDYRLQVELAGSPKILDAYVNWKAAEFLTLRAGQYKVPFSLENPYSPINLETIDNSLVITSLAGYSDVSGVSANGRDIGLGLEGGFLGRRGYHLITYGLGIFDGSGINKTDTNKDKDFAGILSVHPLRTLSLAGYYYNGRADRDQDHTMRRERAGGGAKYNDGKFLLRSEYIRGWTGEITSEGVYAVLGYHITPKCQPVVKYDYFRRDVTEVDTRQQYYTVGVNYAPVKNIRLQLNYSYRTAWGEDYNYVAAQIMAIF